ncbi:MAG: hypothetical protein JNJ57_18695 [Saprospiraceae bacterium]|nr:hypothetical protein [Saprospiraceae bacterium]
MIRLHTIFFFVLFSHVLVAQPISWLTDCSPKNFCLNPGSCTQGAVFMVEKAFSNCANPNVNYSYRIDLNNDGSQEIVSSADTVNGNFALGTHKIIWRATDACGNIVQCTYLFTVRDCNPPNLICINGLTQTLDMPLCDAHFDVDQFILSATDNCTPNNQLQFGIRKAGTGTGFPDNQTVSYELCDNGLNLLEVWVRDAGGLTNQCSNYVLIQTNGTDCTCNPDGDINFSGCVRSVNNQRMSTSQPRVTINSTGGVPNAVHKLKVIATTDSCFTLPIAQLPFGGNYTAVVEADRNDNPLNGITTFDLVLMSKHILGIEPLTSAYQMEAADVNNSNSLTTFDIVETRKLILGIYDSFPQVPSWRLTRPLPNPSDLGSYTAFKDTYQVEINNLQADLNFSGFEFIGIKYGDLNNSVASAASTADDREALILTTDDRWLHAGEEVSLVFKPGKDADLTGWQFGLSANPAMLQLLSVDGLPADNYLLTGNELRALWFDGKGKTWESAAAFLTVRVKAAQACRLSDVLQLDQTQFQAEVYPVGSTHRAALRLHFSPVKHGGNTFLGVAPNPFSEELNFKLELSGVAQAHLEIMNLDGKLAYTDHFNLEKGEQTIRVRTATLPPGRVFTYRLRVGDTVFSGKLVRA